MRKIKFRAWDKKRKRFAPEIEIFSDGSFLIGEIEDSYSGLVYWENKENHILMQYTGLNDKNGKPIFEGDICSIYKGTIDLLNTIVKFNPQHGGFGFYFESIKNFMDRGERSLDLITPYWKKDHIEVIGNIYENKDLLDKQIGLTNKTR